MIREENILKMIIEKESWEEVIYNIVSVEGIDPWNVDLVRLTDSFLRFIKSAEELDFRIPAKIVFVAATLLRLKAGQLSIFEERSSVDEVVEQQKPFIDLGIDPNLIQLGLPMKRIPKRQITLDELISALKKALVVKEKKVERRSMWRAQLQAQIEEEDITIRTERIMREIDELTQKMKESKLKFSQIVDEWKRDEIVEHLIPLLHLEQNMRVKTEQEDYFKEIFVEKVESNVEK